MFQPNDQVLVSAFLQFAYACIANGEQQKLLDLGMTQEEIASIYQLSLDDVHTLSASRMRFLDIQFQGDRFRQCLTHLQNKKMEQRLIEQLILNDAPQSMMQTYFGITSNSYCNHRKRLGLSKQSGRPANCSEHEETFAWQTLKAMVKDINQLSPEDILELHKNTGIALRPLWCLLKQWSVISSTSKFPKIGSQATNF